MSLRLTIAWLALVSFGLIPGPSSARNYTLIFQGHNKLAKGYGLSSFPKIRRLKIVFTGPTALPKGVCSQLQLYYNPMGWSVSSFSDGSNQYSPSTGFTSPLNSPWSNMINWDFEACLDQNGKLTSFYGQFIAYSQEYINNAGYGVLFVSEWGEAEQEITVGYGTQGNPQFQYFGAYGLSIDIDNVYNAQNAVAFDGGDGGSPPTISYK